MNIKLTLFIVFLLYPLLNFAQEKTCSDFKTGIFQNVVEGKPTGTIIEREDGFQMEINKERGLQSKDKVEWINDCSYRLVSLDKDSNYPNLIIKITETGIDYYVFEVSTESNPEKVKRGKMVKVK